MKHRVLLIFILYSTTIFAQQKQKVQASYSMVMNRQMSMEVAEQRCIEQARLKALGEAFGYRVSEVTINQVKETNRFMSDDFQSIAQTQVQGEWIADLEKPSISWSCQNNELHVSATVKGEAMNFPDGGKLQWSLNTCAYPDCASPNTQFKHENNLYLQMKSSESGFVNVYYWDHHLHKMFRLFPASQYNEMKGIKIKADQSYIFFKNPSPFPEHPSVEELQLTVSNEKDQSQTDEIIVIYSKNEIQKPLLTMESGLFGIDEKAFIQWKSGIYSKDNLVDVQSIPVTIVR
jgi:hypothetical protein